MQVTINYWEKGDRFYVNDANKNSIGYFKVARFAYNKNTDSAEKVSEWEIQGNVAAVESVIAQMNDRAKANQIEVSGDCIPLYFCNTWKKMVIATASQKKSIEKLDRVFEI